MGTAAFDRLWDKDPFADVQGGSSSTAPADAFDAAWGAEQSPETKARLAKEVWSKPSKPTPLLQALGVLSSLGRDIPGAEAVQASAGSLVSHLTGKPRSYAESLKDIRAAEDAAPKIATVPARIAGGTLAAMTMPGGAVRQGLTYGAAKGAFQSDPDAGIGERAKDAAIEGTLSAVGGKVAEGLGNVARTAIAKSSGRVAQELDDAITAANVANYGKAAEEGVAAGGSSPPLAKALARPRIAKYVDLVRDGEEGSPTSDAEVARDVLKRMSKHVRGLKKKNDLEYDPAVETEIRKLSGEIKRLTAATAEKSTVTTELPPAETAQSPAPDLRTALREFQARPGIAAARREGTPAQQLARQALERHGAETVVSPPLRGAPGPRSIDTEVPAVMPSLPGARATLAQMEGERGAFETAQDAAKRILNGTSVSGKNQLKKSPEAFARAITKMKPGEAQAALQGVLARAKEVPLHPSVNPMTGFGTLGGLMQRGRLSPFISQLDEQAGNEWPAILRALGIATP